MIERNWRLQGGDCYYIGIGGFAEIEMERFIGLYVIRCQGMENVKQGTDDQLGIPMLVPTEAMTYLRKLTAGHGDVSDLLATQWRVNLIPLHCLERQKLTSKEGIFIVAPRKVDNCASHRKPAMCQGKHRAKA